MIMSDLSLVLLATKNDFILVFLGIFLSSNSFSSYFFLFNLIVYLKILTEVYSCSQAGVMFLLEYCNFNNVDYSQSQSLV